MARLYGLLLCCCVAWRGVAVQSHSARGRDALPELHIGEYL